MFNEHQHRSLSVTLRTIEQHLRAIEQMLGTDDYTGVLCEWRNDVPPSQRDELSAKISLILDRIHTIAEQFSLDKAEKRARQHLAAELSYCWEVLQDAKAKRLRRYGGVDEGLENTLDPQIDILLELLREMQSLLHGARNQDT